MAPPRKKTPDFFEGNSFDPIETATGYPRSSQAAGLKRTPEAETDPPAKAEKKGIQGALKKKAGFYLAADVLERFTLRFYELKLAGVPIDNKSTLLETALSFALDDLDKGPKSLLLQQLAD
jgi:hypothetical protein